MGNDHRKKNRVLEKITLNDIAEKTGVSAMTVSRVVSGKGIVAQSTRDKILAVVKQLDYQPNLVARSLSSQRTMTLGFAIPKKKQMFLDNYIAQILSGVMTVIKQQNYRMMIYPIEDGEDSGNPYLDIARSKLLDGLILLKPKTNNKLLQPLIESGFPTIFINHRSRDPRVNYIDTHNVKGARLAVQYLYEKGCRQIAFVAGCLDESNGLDRLKGYQQALRDLGLSPDPGLVIEANFDAGKAYKEVVGLFKDGLAPDAIFCADDYMAIAVMERLIEMGRKVPDEIAIIGYNNIDIAKYTRPALTTIKQPLLMIGKMAAEKLIDLIENKSIRPIQIQLDVQLIVRESA
ncbi:MAG: LacI family DNA-binding transcriptional regulator [Candidatus Marinimicrobia bacterium]|nr:LacI family DNA-binding transcriptional regulator [Candidatus Neomarinimicrobiota bacterium]